MKLAATAWFVARWKLNPLDCGKVPALIDKSMSCFSSTWCITTIEHNLLFLRVRFKKKVENKSHLYKQW